MSAPESDEGVAALSQGDSVARVAFRLHRDHLYIEAQAFAAHLRGLRCVALLRDGCDLHVVPLVGPEGGGYLVKQINAKGDRAIHAADFFRLNGIDETQEIVREGEWRAATGSFMLPRLFAESPRSDLTG